MVDHRGFQYPFGRNGNEHEIRGFEEALGNVVVLWILLSMKSVEPPFLKILKNVLHAVLPRGSRFDWMTSGGFFTDCDFVDYFCHTNHSLSPSPPDAYKAPCVLHCRLTAVPKRNNSNKAPTAGRQRPSSRKWLWLSTNSEAAFYWCLNLILHYNSGC